MIESFIEKHQLPKYRLAQFNQAFYQQLITSFDELTTWSKDLRHLLIDEILFSSLSEVTSLMSADKKTQKVLFKRLDGQTIETVLMRHKDGRNTVCVSCMVGCPVNCSFCATGKLGFGGNLDSREIIDQVLHFGRILKSENQKITNVVFMGMGEPLLNLQNILSAIQILSDPSKFNLGSRRITISTSGYIPQLQQLIDSGFRGRLAISLHAPNQELRSILMPVAKVYPLDKLLKTLDGYTKLTGKRISYEYILIDQVTDDLEQAKQLVDLFKHRLAHINLIPYNPIPNSEFVRPSKNRIHEFSHVLEQADIPHTIRVTMGDDISAACGQLARNYQNKY